MTPDSRVSDQPVEDMALLLFLFFMYVVTQPVPISFLPQLVEFIKVAFPNVKMLTLALRDEDGNLHEFLYHNPTVPESTTLQAVASSSHGENMAINNGAAGRREREEQQLYFDLGWALANLSCFVQLGGVSRADFTTRQVQAAWYVAVAAVAFILTLLVLVLHNALRPGVRRFMLYLALFFLFLDCWIIKPNLSSR